MKKWFKENWKMFFLGLAIVIMRIALTFTQAHDDLGIQIEWGKWMYDQNSVSGLYNNNIWGGLWPNHPPLISWLYFEAYKIHSQLMWYMSSLGNFIALYRLAPTKFLWFFNFTKWFGETKLENTVYPFGVVVVIKQIMVMADFCIAWIIYKICKKNKVNWKKYVLVYLLLPFSWFLSAVWGQSNQLSFLFLIVSFILLTTKRSIWSLLLYAIAINLKPDCIFLIPLFLFIWIKQKQSWRNLFLGTLLAGVFSIWTVSWFLLDGKLLDLLSLLRTRLNTGDGLLTLNAYNFWYIFYPFPSKMVLDSMLYLWIPAKIWGYVFWIFITGLSFKLIKKIKIEKIFLTIFMISFGGWLFMTGMHERYAFIGLVSLLFYSIYQKMYFKYFIVLSIIYFLSMFFVFPLPEFLNGVKTIFNWEKQLIPKILSLINIFVFINIFVREFKKVKN